MIPFSSVVLNVLLISFEPTFSFIGCVERMFLTYIATHILELYEISQLLVRGGA